MPTCADYALEVPQCQMLPKVPGGKNPVELITAGHLDSPQRTEEEIQQLTNVKADAMTKHEQSLPKKLNLVGPLSPPDKA